MSNSVQAEGTIVEIGHEGISVDVTMGSLRRRVMARRGERVEDVRLAAGDRVVVAVSRFDMRSGVVVRVL